MNNKTSNTTKQIHKLHKKGLTNIEISEKLNISTHTILSALNRFGLKSNRYLNIQEDEKLKQFILGSILGDGYLSKIEGKNKNSRLSFGHGIKQKDYLVYKHNFLNKYKLSGKILFSSIKDERMKSGLNEGYFFKTYTNPIFSKYRNAFYKDNIKFINKDLIKELDAFGIAIWFMDDGSTAKSSYQIQTCSFTKEDIEFLIKLLKNKFDLNCTFQPHNNVLYIKKDSLPKFNNLINPYVITSMKYKIKGSG